MCHLVLDPLRSHERPRCRMSMIFLPYPICHENRKTSNTVLLHQLARKRVEHETTHDHVLE